MAIEMFVLDYCIGLFESFIFFKLMKYRLPIKEGKKAFVGIGLLSAVVFIKGRVAEAGFDEGLLILFMMAMTIGIAHYFFKGSIKTKIANVLIFHLILASTEVITLGSILLIKGMTVERILAWGNLRFVGTMSSKLLAYVAATVIGRFGKQHRTYVATGDLLLEGLALLLLVVGMTLIILPFVTNDSFMFAFEKKWPLVVSVAFMSISGTAVWVYEKLFERSQKSFWLRMENDLLSEQSKYYTKVEELIRHYQSLQHDVNKHMAMVNHYVSDNDYEALKAYTQEWNVASAPLEEVVISQSKVLSGLLTHYKSLAKSKGVDLKIVQSLECALTIPDTDLCIVVGNVLENALLATEKSTVSNKEIQLKLDTNGAYFLMTCQNPHQEKLKKKGILYISTKRIGNQSGLGLTNVTRLVEKYEGEFKINADAQSFEVTLMMLNPLEK